MTRKLFTFVILTAAVGTVALALLKGDPISDADAAVGEALASGPSCSNPGLYTGTSNTGSFQGALDDAIAAAAACAGCCDMLVTWEFVAADGREGGFAGFNEVNVEIKASW